MRLLIIMLICGVSSLWAQHVPERILCGNEVSDYIIQTHYPELQKAFRATFDQANARAVDWDSGPLKVRVVVHVVWRNSEENLHDSVVISQINVLNEDFNRLNPDATELRPIFGVAAGNPQIEFELVEIRRVQTTQTFTLNLLGNEILSNLKTTATGGSDAVDPTAYLNIWICQIQPLTLGGISLGQVLGFAFPPNNLGNWPANSGAPSPSQDGVVLDFRTVGRNNPNPIVVPGGTGNLVVRGRTGTHEVGHYLGLRHIWGDGGLFGLPNNCNESDGVDDTPFANAQSAFDCNKSRNSCVKVEPFYGTDMPDMVENYMDYSKDDCMNTFTAGQAGLMRNVLTGPRAGLIQGPSRAWAPSTIDHLRLFPNPAQDHALLAFELKEPQEVDCRLFGADGRLCWQLAHSLYPSGPTSIRVPLEGLPSGVYYLRVADQVQPLLKR
jgi:hypothetical protein